MKTNKKQKAMVPVGILGGLMMFSAPLIWWMAATWVADRLNELKSNLQATGGLLLCTGAVIVVLAVFGFLGWRDKTVEELRAEMDERERIARYRVRSRSAY